MYFQILGPIDVWDNGRRIEVIGTRRRSLLSMLVVNAGTPVSVGQLIEDLWESRPPRAALATLQSHISALRRLLPVTLPMRHGGYVLEAGAEEIDARVFEREVAAARVEMANGQLRLAAEMFARALGRWRGPAVADGLGAAWAAVEVAHLDELRGAAFESLLSARLILGQHEDVAAMAEAAVARYPLREHLWAHLMVALYRSGRQAEALRAYGRLRHHLSEELGIPPSPPLARLEEAILLQNDELAWPADLNAELSPNGARTRRRATESTPANGSSRPASGLAAMARFH